MISKSSVELNKLVNSFFLSAHSRSSTDQFIDGRGEGFPFFRKQSCRQGARFVSRKMRPYL